jgi:hypothetical protein
MKKIVLGAALAAVMALPFSASAATYQYVNYLGEVKSVEANDPMEAIRIAPLIAVHSGVMLVRNGLAIPSTVKVAMAGFFANAFQI